MKERFAIVDEHGECFGVYDTRDAAERDLHELGRPDDLGIIKIDVPTPGLLARLWAKLTNRPDEPVIPHPDDWFPQ